MSNGNFVGQFTEIKGISSRRRLPLLGKIRLGIVRKNKSGLTKKCNHKPEEYCEFCSHPEEVPYFLVPPEVEKIHGANPTSLEVMFPIDHIPAIFPQAYKWYGFTGLKCIGNGETALRWNEEQLRMVERECPCEELKSSENEKGQCSKRANLYVILWKVNMGGVYRVCSGSGNTIIDVQSGLDYHKALIGRFARVPLILKRRETETTYIDDKGKRHKSIHYPLIITSMLSLEEVSRLRKDTERILPEITQDRVALPAEIDDNPLADKGAIIVSDEEKPEVVEPDRTETRPSVSPELKQVDVPFVPEPKRKTLRENFPGKTTERLLDDNQRKRIMALCNDLKYDTNIRLGLIKYHYKKDSVTKLTQIEASNFIHRKLEECLAGRAELSFTPEGEPNITQTKKER
jgi:hypothetical protein